MSVLDTVGTEGAWDEPQGLLAAVGIPVDQERVYLYVLDRPGVTASTAARSMAMARAAIEETIDDLVLKGLITIEPGPMPRYYAVAPDVAIEALIAHQQDELARARLAAMTLRDRARQAAGDHAIAGDGYELVKGGLAAAQRLWQLQVAAEREVCVVGLPVGSFSAHGNDVPAEVACLRRGASHRTVVDRETLGQPGVLDDLRSYVDAGGEARVAEAPARLVLIDGRVAALPTYADGHTLTGLAVVRSAPVFAVLAALCEVIWSQSSPLVFTAAGSAVEGNNGAATDVVPMLVAGCKDEAIARQLGVSTRTLDRRIRAMMDQLGAVTRFQAGWLAAQLFRQ